MQIFLTPHNLRMRATENASRNPCRLLERFYALAEITERGAGVVVERPGVIHLQRERDRITLSVNASRYGDIFAQERFAFFVIV